MTDLIGRTKVVCDTGSTQANLLHVGSEGGITHDQEFQSLRIHDGTTPGGRLIKEGAFRDIATSLGSDPSLLVTLSLILNYLLPVGAVIAWYGSEASIPTGWVLCDGQNGTPDLRNKTIIGAGGTDSGGEYIPGQTGGSDSVFTDFQGTHAHTAVTDSGGGHLHLGNTDLNGEHIHGGSASSNGVHGHTLSIVAATAPHTHVLTIDTATPTWSTLATIGITPNSVTHNHNIQAITGNHVTNSVWLDTFTPGTITTGIRVVTWDGNSPPTGHPYAVNVASNVHLHTMGNLQAGSDLASHEHFYQVTGGQHGHNGTLSASDIGGSTVTSHTHTGTAVDNGSHDHVIATNISGEHLHSYTTNYEAAHVHGITTTSFDGSHRHEITDNLPPYMALCWIMFVGTA